MITRQPWPSTARYKHGIEAIIMVSVAAMPRDPDFSGIVQATTLPGADGGFSARALRPELDLDESKASTTDSDQIDLASRATKAARDDPVAAHQQEQGRYPFRQPPGPL